METDVSQDFQDYWNECIVESPVLHDDKVTVIDESTCQSPAKSDDEGVDDLEWLKFAGLPIDVADVFKRGEEISEDQLEAYLNDHSEAQIIAIQNKVNTLNQTVRRRTKQKRRKPVRELFRDLKGRDVVQEQPTKPVETAVKNVKNGSAENIFTKEELYSSYPPYSSLPDYININSVDGRICLKEELTTASKKELFKKTTRTDRNVVASECPDGIKMVGFQRFGTIYDRNWNKNRLNQKENSTLNHDTGFESTAEKNLEIKDNSDNAQPQSLGFEQLCQQPGNWKSEYEPSKDELEEENILGRTCIDLLAEEDRVVLQKLIFIELSLIFDKSKIKFQIKDLKVKRKHEGNIFGCSLSCLLEKDAATILNKEQSHHVPLIFSKLLNQLENRGLHEPGVLRLAGNKAKTDSTIQTVEKDFYTEMENVDQLIHNCAIHDLVAIFKKLLRDLPEPLLTFRLINWFYQSHVLQDCENALNYMVLLLPAENRLTLLAILSFMNKLVEHEAENKMNKHSVAMILAPSILPPGYINTSHANTSSDLQAQLNVAAKSCQIIETLMSCQDRLDKVPCSLITQLRHKNDKEKYHLKKKLLGHKKSPVVVVGDIKLIDNEMDHQKGIIRVSAPQFNLEKIPFNLDEKMTAGDVVLRLTKMGCKSSYSGASGDKHPQLSRKDKNRALIDLAPNGNLSCFLATADSDSQTTLRTHFLYEIGGNIGQRCLEANARVIAVHRQNPNASWKLKCDHRNAIKYNN